MTKSDVKSLSEYRLNMRSPNYSAYAKASTLIHTISNNIKRICEKNVLEASSFKEIIHNDLEKICNVDCIQYVNDLLIAKKALEESK